MRNDYTEVTKSSRTGGISKKEQVEAHDAAFGDLLDTVSKETGLPGDEVLYKDYMGFHTGGEPVDLVSKMYDGNWEDAFSQFNDEVRKGASVYDAAQEVKKAADTSNYSLPIFVSPEVTVTDKQRTPFADMVARVAIQESEYKTDEVTDWGDAARFYEPGSNAGSNETWAENDDTTANHTYKVVPYGRQTAVTDFLQLSTNTLRSSRALTEEGLVTSIRYYEEAQGLVGTGSETGVTANDANGYDGLIDLAATGNIDDEGGSNSLSESHVRGATTALRSNGADYDDLVFFTDYTSFESLKTSVDDFVRYQSPGEGMNFGFRALNVDGVPVMESHGLPDADGSRVLVGADMSTVVQAMLQDATLHPLARTSPQEDIAVDAYGTLAASAPDDRIYAVKNLA